MSEILKNIETCRGEDVLAEVSALPQDPHFGSLVNEALDPLKQQAAAQEGWDGYSEVIAQHKPYTFASAIIQMKSNLLLLLRALWQYPFGTGTLRSLSDDASLRSLADMWSHYITRLSGNETYGIPSRLSSLTDLPSAPLLVADRKISGADVPDGISLVHQLGNSAAANAITEIDDDNHGWVLDKAIGNIAPNCERATIRCGSITVANALNSFVSEIVTFPEMETITSGASQYNDPMPLNSKEIYADEVTASDAIFSQKSYPNLEKVSMKKVRSLNGRSFYDLQAEGLFHELRVPELRTFDTWAFLLDYSGARDKYLNLILLEIGSDVSCNISNWNPTNALSTESNDLVIDERTTKPEGVDVSNWKNLDLFLYNFRTYIALRLATFASNGPTLTLSQAVFSSIWDANGNPQVLQDGLDQLRADIHNIVKTTKHWDVNKAN